MADFKFDNFETGGASGMDALFATNPTLVSPVGAFPKRASATPKARRVKVGSLSQLNGFQRVSSETLINTSTRDLWTIQKEGNEYYIERLFNDDGNPQKG